jgi:hypothetical protein
LKITAVGNNVAKKIGDMGLTLFFFSRSDSDLKSSSSEGSKERDLDSEKSAISDDGKESPKETTMPDPLQSPLLFFLFK